MLDLFRYKEVRNITIFTNIVATIPIILYYAVTFSLNNLGKDIYVNTLIISIFEFFGYFASSMVISKIKRKKTFMILFIITSIISFLYYFLKTPDKSSDYY